MVIGYWFLRTDRNSENIFGLQQEVLVHQGLGGRATDCRGVLPKELAEVLHGGGGDRARDLSSWVSPKRSGMYPGQSESKVGKVCVPRPILPPAPFRTRRRLSGGGLRRLQHPRRTISSVLGATGLTHIQDPIVAERTALFCSGACPQDRYEETRVRPNSPSWSRRERRSMVGLCLETCAFFTGFCQGGMTFNWHVSAAPKPRAAAQPRQRPSKQARP